MIGFFKLGQPLITQHPNFSFCPRKKTEEHERLVSTYKVHKTLEGCEQSQTLVMIFFCPKIDEFCMVLCRVTLDGQLWPSICSSSRLGFPLKKFPRHSYRGLLSTWEIVSSLKHDILLQSFKTVILKAAHLTFKTKLSTMGSFDCWTKSYFSNNSPFNCCQVGFVKFWQNSWLLSTFVKAGPTFVLGLFWSNVNEGSPKFAFGNCPGLGNRRVLGLYFQIINLT